MTKFHSILSVLVAICIGFRSNPIFVSATQETEAIQSHQQQPQSEDQNQLRRRELQSLQQALDQNRAKWNSFGINEYIYHIKSEDFYYDITFACRVTNNQVLDLDSTLEVTSNSTLNLPSLSPPTVLGFFDDIQKAIRSNKNPNIQVTYDATYGYPKVINLDYGQAAPGFFFLTDSIKANVETMIPVSIETARANEAKAKWLITFLEYWDSFDATYQEGQNYKVQVRSGALASVRDESNRDVTSTFRNNNDLLRRVTIFDSYTEVRSILNVKKPKTFSVSYHPTYGYITSMSATYSSYTNDGGNTAYSIISLENQGTSKPMAPSSVPSEEPSTSPPSTKPTVVASDNPTRTPTTSPSLKPTVMDSSTPTRNPSHSPSVSPTSSPSKSPSNPPTPSPSFSPSTSSPTTTPTKEPCKPRFVSCIADVSECCNPNDRCGSSGVCRPASTNAKNDREKLSRDRAFTGIPSRNGGRRGLQVRGM